MIAALQEIAGADHEMWAYVTGRRRWSSERLRWIHDVSVWAFKEGGRFEALFNIPAKTP